jgi:hypothetical protein
VNGFRFCSFPCLLLSLYRLQGRCHHPDLSLGEGARGLPAGP